MWVVGCLSVINIYHMLDFTWCSSNDSQQKYGPNWWSLGPITPAVDSVLRFFKDFVRFNNNSIGRAFFSQCRSKYESKLHSYRLYPTILYRY